MTQWPRKRGRFFLRSQAVRRIFHYLINNIREHFMLYVILWSLLAIMYIIYIMFF